MSTNTQETDFLTLARAKWEEEGECEIDADATISLSEDADGVRGAYVHAWVWVDAPARDTTDDDCTCSDRSWYGEGHDSACPVTYKVAL
jgi:hypothetical protein